MAMIKKILLLFVLTSATILNLKAQDTSAYELQRAKINIVFHPLALRYNASLTG